MHPHNPWNSAYTATIDSLMTTLDRFYKDGSIKNKGVYTSLKQMLQAAEKSKTPEGTSAALNGFVKLVKIHSGKHIEVEAADILIADGQWVITHLPDTSPPYIFIFSPRAATYKSSQSLRLDFDAFDTITGVEEIAATLDGVTVTDDQKIELRTLALGEHTLTVQATDYAGNTAIRSVKFKVVAHK